MTTVRTPIHASSNGDRWFLCHGGDPADVFVFHEPNEASGGTATRIGIVDFLSTDLGSPERRELLRMIGTLVEAGHASPANRDTGPEPGAAAAEPTPGEALPIP
ncbi:hypothetical protein [Methylobacterium haplocladii]|uniref:Uncharacterized protein n=1 Tax=Methylobacterium haplocladii TaxID=1176176 RepID=A0A512IQV9_9HYPH|nr:hypothetical protein [Methylobacterium haplocladii]GEP00009.1 hypothetical protein MHA02_23960 [Methylobacterium haplocladii]GJD85725.1 hypothetical protein HPGCJGGD_3616 [Methylobacterium haplocladii]GLS59889.1 hypothetical protein GCM10007887_25620 [Methylobacterium haplocladii]